MFQKILTQLARALHKAQIPYMVIGGQAVLLYGEPRLTKDIDITVGIDIDQKDRILALLPQVELSPLIEDLTPFLSQTMVLPAIHPKSGIRLSANVKKDY